MRGYIFEVSTTVDNLGTLGEDDFYGALSELGANYVEDVNGEEKLRIIQDTLKDLYDQGAEKLELDSNFGIILTDACKENYFRKRYHAIKKMVSEMSLQEFATSDLYSLRSNIEDTYSDIVYFNDTEYTFDRWLREAEVDVPYYFGNVIIMH